MADNPYAPPTAPVKDMDATAPLINRPKSPKVIGIIFLIMSGFGLLSIIQNLYMIVRGDVAFMSVMNSISNVGVNYYYFTFGLGILTSAWLIFIAIQLIRYRDIGRRHYNFYLIVSLITALINATYMKMNSVTETFFTSYTYYILFFVIMAILYLIPWRYLNKPATKASLS